MEDFFLIFVPFAVHHHYILSLAESSKMCKLKAGSYAHKCASQNAEHVAVYCILMIIKVSLTLNAKCTCFTYNEIHSFIPFCI